MAIFLKQTPKKNRVYLQLVDGYYDKKTKNAKQVVVRKLGYLDDLSRDYQDPIAFFKQEAELLNQKVLAQTASRNEARIPDQAIEKNLGYFPLKRLHQELGIEKMMHGFQQLGTQKLQYRLHDVFEMLTYARVIDPLSKIANFQSTRSKFFEDFDFSRDQMYHALEFFGQHDQKILEGIQYHVAHTFKRKLDHVFFDCTNFYMEIDRPDGLKQNGPSKEDRKAPIIGLGLLLDGDAIPLAYQLYPGNASEKPVMRDILSDMKNSHALSGRTIRVADKGLNCGDNIYDALQHGDGYIYSQTVKGSDDINKKWILLPNDYLETRNEHGDLIYKVKSCIDDFVIHVTAENGQKSKLTVKQKRVVFWSKNFAEKQAIERDRLLRKAEKLLNSPQQFKHKVVGNEAKYIEETLVDEDGVLLDIAPFLSLNQQRVDQESALDGYYMIVTSELAADDQDIIDTYRMLWEIEESFRITKSELRARPVYVSTELAIRGHFLICFYALTLLRLIQKKKLDSRIPLSSLIKTMRNYRCIRVQPDQYMLIYKDKNLEWLSKYYSKKLDRLYKSTTEIKQLFH